MARVDPVATIPDELLAQAHRAAGGSIRPEANVHRTLANHPKLFLAWLSLGGHLLGANELPPDLRELVILRTGLLSNGRYPVAQHVRIGRAVGLSDDDLRRVGEPAEKAGWAPATAMAIGAVDQLTLRGSIDASSVDGLLGQHGAEGVLDLIATVAFYRMAAWMLNACETPLDEGQIDPGVSDRATHTKVGGEPRVGAARREVLIDPLPTERWPPSLLEETEHWPRFEGRPEIRAAGVYCTLANNARLFAAIGPVMAHLLIDNTLSDRHREIVIVRSCLLDRGAYPYRQHVRIASTAGVDDHSLQRLSKRDPQLVDPTDAAIVAAIDELHRTDHLADATWDRLCRDLSSQQIMDMIVTAGFYGLISFVLNSAGTPLEAGTVELPPRPFAKGPS